LVNISPPPRHTYINFLFLKIVTFIKQCGKNVVELGSPRMTIRRMRIACWIAMAIDTHSECVIPIAFPLQQWLHERASMLSYKYIACLI